MANKWMIVFALLMSGHVFAAGGNELGNGGDVFYCQNPTGVRVEMVDLAEARMNGRQLDLGPAGLSAMDKVRYVLGRWAEVSPLRTKQYLEWLARFESESRILPGTLPNVSDEGIVVIPPGCQIQQVAIQLAEENLGGAYKRITISQELWNAMDEDNRAVLILHELIFREAIEARNPISLRVRSLNEVLISASPLQEYFDASRYLGARFLEWGWGGLDCGYQDEEKFLKSQFSDQVVLFGSIRNGCRQVAFNIPGFRAVLSCMTERSCGVPYKIEATERGIWNVLDSDSYGLTGISELRPTQDAVVDGFSFRGVRSPMLARFRDFRRLNGRSNERAEIQFDWIDADQVSVEMPYRGYGSDLKARWSCTGVTAARWTADGSRMELQSVDGRGNCEFTAGERVRYSLKAFRHLTMKSLLTDEEWKKSPVSFLEFDGEQTRQFQLGSVVAECRLEPGMTPETYRCSQLPSSFQCNVFNGRGWVEEKITLADPSVRQDEYWDAQLYLPKGQVVGYRKSVWNTQPEKLTADSWVAFSWSAEGCKVKY